MPDKKVFLPLAAAVGLAVVLWLAFHDRSTEPAAALPSVAAPAK